MKLSLKSVTKIHPLIIVGVIAAIAIVVYMKKGGMRQASYAEIIDTIPSAYVKSMVPASSFSREILPTLNNVRPLDNSETTGQYLPLKGEGTFAALHGESSYKNGSNSPMRNSLDYMPVTVPSSVLNGEGLIIAGSDQHGGKSYWGGIGMAGAWPVAQ